MCAGANAPAWLWERAAEVLGVQEMTTAYGMTETGGAPAAARPELGVEHVSTTVGQVRMGGVAAAPGMNGLLAEVATVDPDTGERLPEGAEGELISRGPTNAIGYWKRPEATAETFRDGWVFTGDLARILADGSIVLTGRKKEMIRSGGENFAPKEVEDLLTRHPAVSQAYVVGVPDVKWGESCCAWIVREPHTEVSAEELIEFCRDKLAAFKRPRQVLFHRGRGSAEDADRQGAEVRPRRDGRAGNRGSRLTLPPAVAFRDSAVDVDDEPAVDLTGQDLLRSGGRIGQPDRAGDRRRADRDRVRRRAIATLRCGLRRQRTPTRCRPRWLRGG